MILYVIVVTVIVIIEDWFYVFEKVIKKNLMIANWLKKKENLLVSQNDLFFIFLK